MRTFKETLDRSRQYYFIALCLGVLLHGSLLVFTVGNTYDAYVHMFFADHYSEHWFDCWNYKWYGGFTMTSYPPLVHQVIALLSKVFSLKAGFIIWSLFIVAMLIRGMYHFSLLWVTRIQASYAAILTALSGSITEALHIFGQLPSLTGAALLLNACPLLYRWMRGEGFLYFFGGVSLLACVTSAHHVTTIFGMVFFVLPLLGTAVLDNAARIQGGMEHVSFGSFMKQVWKAFPKLIVLGILSILIVIVWIFPYWYWSISDPIKQVPIPHGSRASFIEQPNLGIVFFLIPWSVMLFMIPGIFAKIFSRRSIFLALSFSLLFLLGTGGTTPLPKMILGETAFNILTLDRFTFWASLIAIPFFASLLYSFFEGSLHRFLRDKLGFFLSRSMSFLLAGLILFSVFLIINFGNIRPIQPDPIDPQPIVNFLERDGHDQWRYLTLGFGDQVAWISAQTDAITIDGNYHSVRRLPEMTSRAVERLENAKYLGVEGIGSLRDFLGFPEKYHLKYVLSNDKFYQPLLHFTGWSNLGILENGIEVWERKDVPPLPSVLPRKDIPDFQRIMWGVLPLFALFLAFVSQLLLFRSSKDFEIPFLKEHKPSTILYVGYLFWAIVVALFIFWISLQVIQENKRQATPELALKAYYHHLDFKEFDVVYDLLDPNTKPTKDRFSLGLSLEDGIKASYAKLDDMIILSKEQLNENKIKVRVETHWLTALDEYVIKTDHVLVKEEGDWFIQYEELSKDIPPDQFIRMPAIEFFDQGRRIADPEKTRQEDILDRPELMVKEANLVYQDSLLFVVGELVNMDNDPAFFAMSAIVYKNGTEIQKSTLREAAIRHLLPKETSYFKVNLGPVELEDTDIELAISTVVSSDKVYRYFGVSDLLINAKSALGTVVNYGNKEMSIPQVLIGHYSDNALQWVQEEYISSGVRPQRSKSFQFSLDSAPSFIRRIRQQEIVVNGVSQDQHPVFTFIKKGRHPASFSNEGHYDIQLNALVKF